MLTQDCTQAHRDFNLNRADYVCLRAEKNNKSMFSHLPHAGFYQRAALQDKGSTQNVGSLEEMILRSNKELRRCFLFFPCVKLFGCLNVQFTCLWDSLLPAASFQDQHQSSTRAVGWCEWLFFLLSLLILLLFHFILWTAVTICLKHTNNAQVIKAVSTITQTDCFFVVFLCKTVHFQLPIYVHKHFVLMTLLYVENKVEHFQKQGCRWISTEAEQSDWQYNTIRYLFLIFKYILTCPLHPLV